MLLQLCLESCSSECLFYGAMHAMEITVLSAGAVEAGVEAFAHHIKKETGHDLKIQFNTAPQIAKRLAVGEVFDILISPPSVIEQAAKEGKVVLTTRVPVGRVGVGIAVRNGAPMPEIATTAILREAVLGADRIVYNQASTGLYMEKLFDSMGITQQVNAKAVRYPNGASVLAHLIQGNGNEIGFGAMTEIRSSEAQGVKFVGPLPPSSQNWTSYQAVRMRGGASPQLADVVLKEFTSQDGKSSFRSAGIEQ